MLSISIFLLIANSSVAQELTPVQRYIQDETGYTPLTRGQQVAIMRSLPYKVTQAQPVYMPSVASPPAEGNRTPNSGVNGMNF